MSYCLREARQSRRRSLGSMELLAENGARMLPEIFGRRRACLFGVAGVYVVYFAERGRVMDTRALQVARLVNPPLRH
jgi:hypothetical protein